MAMMLNNNGGMGLGTLNKNITEVGKALRKVTSGERITGAADSASEFAIGRNMRVLTRALGQDIENSQKGIDLVNTAERGINSIVDELRNLKKMALDSANDHNTDQDRAIIQKEFASRMEEIDDIAATTEYNGIYLLDGRWGFHEYVEYKPGKCGCLPTGKNSCTCTTDKTSNLKLDTTVNSIAPAVNTNAILPTALNTKTNEPFALNSLSTAPIKFLKAGNSNNILLGAGDSTVPSLKPNGSITPNKIDGIFPSSPSGTSLTYGISGYIPDYTFADRIKWTTPLTEMMITVNSNGKYEPSLYMMQNGNIPVELNTNPNNPSYSFTDTVYVKSDGKYVPVKIEKDDDGYLAISQTGENIADDVYGYVTDFTFANATLKGKSLNLPTDLNNQTISILCEVCAQFVGIKLETNRPAGTGVMFTPKQTGIDSNQVVYVVGIGKEAKTEQEILANIFKGIQNARKNIDPNANNPNATDVTLIDDGHAVNLHHYTATDTYCFVKATGPAPIFYNGGIGELSGGGEEEYGVDDTIPGGEDTTPGGQDTIPGGEDTTPGGQDTTPGGQDTTPGGQDTTPGGQDTTPGSDTPTIPATCDCYHETVSRFEGNPLVIHTGPKANQRLYVYIKCMKSEAMGLKDIGVQTREKALESLDKLDFALEYALNEATTMGAYQMRLNQTVETLTVRHENTISAESVITDADMAKEMTSYVKHNVLAQASQAMLAQANQNRSNILSLLQ